MMTPLSYKKAKPISVGKTAQIVSEFIAKAWGVPWGALVFVAKLDREFAQATVVVGEKIRSAPISLFTGIENDEDVFTRQEWDHAAKCISLVRYAAACSAIEALE